MTLDDSPAASVGAPATSERPAGRREQVAASPRTVPEVLRQHGVVVAVTLVVALAGGWLVTQLVRPVYETRATVFLQPQTDGEVVSIADAATFATEQAQTYAALVLTPAVLDPAIARSGVDTDSVTLAEDLQVSVVPLTTLIQVEVSAEGAREAAELASAVAVSLVAQVEAQSEVAGQTLLTGTVVEEPLVPEEPASPRPLLNLALALAIGIAVSGVAVALREASWRTRRLRR